MNAERIFILCSLCFLPPGHGDHCVLPVCKNPQNPIFMCSNESIIFKLLHNPLKFFTVFVFQLVFHSHQKNKTKKLGGILPSDKYISYFREIFSQNRSLIFRYYKIPLHSSRAQTGEKHEVNVSKSWYFPTKTLS